MGVVIHGNVDAAAYAVGLGLSILYREVEFMKKEHHSVGDFNFSSGYWSLDTTYKVSAPSSVHFLRISGDPINYCLLKHALSGPVEQGRIASWFFTNWLNGNRWNVFVFRSKAADGGAATFPFYAVRFTQISAQWVKMTAPNTATILQDWGDISGNWITAGDWRCLRVSWWNGMNLLNVPATVCRLEVNIGGVWYADIDAYDTAELNKGEPVQRCGVGFHGHETGVSNWIDDTEFYLPV